MKLAFDTDGSPRDNVSRSKAMSKFQQMASRVAMEYT